MEFQKLLLDVGKALNKDEVRALTFLCTDLLGKNLTSVELASDLYSHLVDQDYLSAEHPLLLTELLLIIQRIHLIRQLKLSELPHTYINKISSYRKLLYNLSEELSEENVKEIKFLLNGKLPRRKLEDNVTILEVFLEMEHKDLINESNLTLLEDLLKSCCPVLKEKITKFKEQQAVPLCGLIAQETGRPRSVSYPLEPNQSLPSFGSVRSLSGDFQDAPNVITGGNSFESLNHGLSTLSTSQLSSSSTNVRSDAHVITQSESNVNSSKGQIAQMTKTDTEDLGSYPMSAAKKRVCVIINNYDFSSSVQGLLKREGTQVDEESLTKVFEWLHFQVEIFRDCKKEEILSVVQELGKRDYSDMDCLVCCILSHGEQDVVFGVDGLTVDLKELREPFNGSNCLSLVDKPKLFFIQACQGRDTQRPVHIESDSPAICIPTSVRKDSIPFDADFLLAMATVPHFVSFRERDNGTWFIQTLCKNLIHMVPKGDDLVSILTKVNADVSQKVDNTGRKKQMPQPAFTLRKKVIFPNPQSPPPILH